MMTENRRRINELETLVHQLSWNDAFGCHTRAGFEKMVWPAIAARVKWLIFFDVDGVHAMNEQYGNYDHFDAIMKEVLSIVRGTDYVAGQFKSGDEFLIALTERVDGQAIDPQGLVARLAMALASHGMSATFAVVPVKSTDLLENVQPAIDKVYEAKKARGVSR